VTSDLIVEPSKPDTVFSVGLPNESYDRRAQIVKNISELRLVLLKVERGRFEPFHTLAIEKTLPTRGEEVFAQSFPMKEVGLGLGLPRLHGLAAFKPQRLLSF
jgi:hypothetical protein